MFNIERLPALVIYQSISKLQYLVSTARFYSVTLADTSLFPSIILTRPFYFLWIWPLARCKLNSLSVIRVSIWGDLVSKQESSALVFCDWPLRLPNLSISARPALPILAHGHLPWLCVVRLSGWLSVVPVRELSYFPPFRASVSCWLELFGVLSGVLG